MVLQGAVREQHGALLVLLAGHAAEVPLIHEGVNPHIQAHIAGIPPEEHARLKALGNEEPAGILAVNVNTGKECHLDAHLVDHALDELDLDSIDFLFVENVGNLVCPADFPLGTDHRMVVISVTEGDDMIRKQPLIFLESDLAVLNKIDLLPHVDMDIDRLDADYARFKKGARLFRTSAKTGEGLGELFKALNIHA